MPSVCGQRAASQNSIRHATMSVRRCFSIQAKSSEWQSHRQVHFKAANRHVYTQQQPCSISNLADIHLHETLAHTSVFGVR